MKREEAQLELKPPALSAQEDSYPTTIKRSVSCLVDLETDLNKIGSYLLSHLKGSTIGVDGLNFSVRDGKRWNTVALAT